MKKAASGLAKRWIIAAVGGTSGVIALVVILLALFLFAVVLEPPAQASTYCFSGSYVPQEGHDTPNMSIVKIAYDVVKQRTTGLPQEEQDELMLATFEVALVESPNFSNPASEAYSESKNYPHDYVAAGDYDSVGVMQQRPGWGSYEERMTPATSIGKFVDAAIAAYLTSSPGELAADVQRPAARYRSRYGEEEAKAKDLITQAAAMPATGDTGCNGGDGSFTPAGQTRHVVSHGEKDPAGGTPYDIVIPAGAAGIAVNAALNELDVKYSWGGGGPNGPSTGICEAGAAANDCHITGFDCSGLTEYAWYAAINRSIGGTTATQKNLPAATGGHLPGDLILYAPGNIHHVALYLGNDLIVEAPHSGDVVRISKAEYPDTISHWVRPA